jgi:hypothetical protein
MCSATYWNISVRALRACMLCATAEWSVLGFRRKTFSETHTHCAPLTLNRKMVHSLHLENQSDDVRALPKNPAKRREHPIVST